jgi:hypothetical protein
MASSKFGRDAMRIQPAPKVCISKLAEQFPSEMKWGKLAIAGIAFTWPSLVVPEMLAFTVLASLQPNGMEWKGIAFDSLGGKITVTITRDPDDYTISVRARFQGDSVDFEEWQWYLQPKMDTVEYTSQAGTTVGSILGVQATIALTIS